VSIAKPSNAVIPAFAGMTLNDFCQENNSVSLYESAFEEGDRPLIPASGSSAFGFPGGKDLRFLAGCVGEIARPGSVKVRGRRVPHTSALSLRGGLVLLAVWRLPTLHW
jgi:hypothetical protein